MNNIDGLSSQLANLIQSLYKISSRDKDDGNDTIFQSCVPSNPIDLKQLNNQNQIKDQFQADFLPLTNQISWSVSNVSLSQKFQEVLQKVYLNYEIENTEISDEEIQKVAEEIDEIIDNIDILNIKVEQSINSLSVSQDPNKIQKIQKFRQNIKEQNQKLIEIIQKNISVVLKMQQEKIKNQISSYGCLPVNLQPENIKDMLAADQNNENSLGFKQFSYNSKAIQSQIDNLKDSFIQKLGEKLKGYGIGQTKSQDQLTFSIKDAFESIQVDLEWKRIDFKRDWLNINLLKILLGELELNGNNSSDVLNQQTQISKIIPFVQVAAIVVKNIKIKGFNDVKQVRRNLMKIQTEPESSFIFQFQASSDIDLDDSNEMIIKMRTPRILGYVLKPIFPIQKQEEQEIEYSLTDNSIIIQKLSQKDFSLRDIMWPKKQKIKVRFIGQDSSKQNFANLSNLYKECIQQWTQNDIPLYIDVDEDNNPNIFKEYKDGYQLVHVKVDDSGQIFTLGIGNTLQKLQHKSDYNQLFGLKEFNLLIKQSNPNNQIVNKCRRVILHELGHVIGFIQEFKNIDDQFDQQKVYKSYKKNLEKLQNDQVLRIQYQNLEDEINSRVQINIINKRIQTNFEKFDERSIMYQPFPDQWVKNSKKFQPNNYPSQQDFSVLDDHYGIFKTYKKLEFQQKSSVPIGTISNLKFDLDSGKNYIKELQKSVNNDNQNSRENQINAQPQFNQRKRLNMPVIQGQNSEINNDQNLIQNQIVRPCHDPQVQINQQVQLNQNQRFENNINLNQNHSNLVRSQNEFMKTLDMNAINRRNIYKETEEQKFGSNYQQQEIDISNLSNNHQKDFMISVRQDCQNNNITQTRNPQSEIQSNINDDSQIFQTMDISNCEINLEDVQVYHPKIEIQRENIESYINENYNQEDIIEFVQADIEMIPNWKNQIIQLINEVQLKKSNPEENKKDNDQEFLQLNIPQIDDNNKRLFVKALKSKQFNQNNEDLIQIKKTVPQQTLKTLKSYYDKYGAISNKLQDLSDQEISQSIQQMKQGNINFSQLKKQTLIHESVLKQIYNNELGKILIHKQLVEPFLLINDVKLEQETVAQMIFQENDQLKKNLLSIFKNSYYAYDSIKKYIIINRIADFLLVNEVEEFISHIQNDKNIQSQQKQMKFLKEMIKIDQLYCLQLLYYLNKVQSENDEVNQKKNEKEVDPKATWAIKNRNYQVLQVNQNKNIARVINKAFLILTSGDVDTSYNFQYKYEKRNIFQNDDQKNISQFLEDFKKYNSSNISFNEKQDQFENHLLKSKMNLQKDDYNFVKRYLEEDEGYEQLMKHLGKRNGDDKQNDDIEFKDLEQISQNLKIPIVLHQEDDFKNFKAFGSNFDIINSINIIDHSKNSSYSILKLIDIRFKLDYLSVEDFKMKNKEIYDILPLWMKMFFGYKSLINFIQNQNNKVEYLQELVQIYQRYENESSEDLQRMLQKQCIIVQNADKYLFEEWYKDIQNNKQGKKFASYFDFFMARTNPEYLLKIQIETKKIFEDPQDLLTLKDFNRLCSRIDKNELHKLFQDTIHDSKLFSMNVINQLFGFLNRRESMQSFVSDLKNVVKSVSISSRFLMNFLLQNCDLNLKSRIIYYQSEYFSVPLIMNCLVSYESRKQNLLYLPEIAFNMLDGAGIFNLAAGNRSIYQIGKSQLLNDIIIPVIDNHHEAFEQQDKNIFSSGQVDVFFEKSFSQKRNIVLMDGQGNLKDEAINSSLILTDLVMLHFHRQDFQDQNQIQDLKDKIQMIQNANNQWNKKIHIMLIIRDAQESLIIKQYNIDKISHTYPQIKDLENLIDSCVQLENLGNLQKNLRIEKIYPLLQHFYTLIEQYENKESRYSFTRKNYIDNFLAQNQQNDETTSVVKNIFQKTEEFMDQVDKIKDNVFQENAFPVLDFKNQIRQKIIQIRNSVYHNEIDLQQEEEERHSQELKKIYDNLKIAKPSKILLKFHEIITGSNSLIILQEISKQLRIVTQQGIQDAKNRRSKLLSLNVNKSTQIISYSESFLKTQNLNKQLNAIDEEIYQKSISLEYFWRTLTFYTEHTESDFKNFSQQPQKGLIFESINSQLLNGSCFELIDGENLEFKGKILNEIIGKQYKADKVIVVCVIGPQSSGKSTLMNFAFGTQFFTSSGRCTKGIYFTLQLIPEEFREKSDVKWLLILDTEGLQSPERIDAEYDRKIVLFAMLCADILIINNKGEINSFMIETLTMCCLTFDNLRKFCSCPEILYVNCQQNEGNKDPFKRQLQDMKQKVKEQSESETIDETAEELLSVRDENLLIMGYAYKNESIEKDQKKGIKDNNQFKVSVTNFGVETSNIFKFIKSYISRKSQKLNEISFWLENSQYNWNLIDKYSSNLIQFSNMLEMKIDKKVQAYLIKLWNDYLFKNSELDDLKCNDYKQNLVDILKRYGLEDMNNELHKIENFNNDFKEFDLKKYIFDPFDQWKMEQKGITVASEKKHKSLIRSKMEAIKNEFQVKLRAKIQEEQMMMVNKNGHKRILNKANEIQKDSYFNDLDKTEQKQYLEKQFQENWDKSLEEIQGIAQIDQMKKSYFYSLIKTFKSFNPFINFTGEQQYFQILMQLDKFKISNDQNYGKKINYDQLIKFIMEELTKIEDQEKKEDSQKLFSFNNEMLYQIKENPKERIFDGAKEEQYLQLKELINCNYIYTVNKDLSEELDKDALSSQMFKELTIQKQTQKVKLSQNYYGHQFKEKIIAWDEDVAQQQSNLRLLFLNLREAGFMIKVKDKYSSKIELRDLQYLNKQIDQFFEDFEPFGKDKDFKRRENKKAWIKQFVDNIVFNKSLFQKIDPRISSCFKSQEYQVKNRQNPNETLEFHQQSIAQLQNVLFIQEPQIKYFASKNAQKISAIAMKILISPIQSESDVLVKWQKLSQVALQKLNWGKIAVQIIQSVQSVLGNNDYESRNSSINEDEEVSIDNIMKLNQISYEQVKTLESEYLSVKLREIINSELHSKMGLYMNEQMNAKISWCALLVTWIELFQKAVYSFNKQYGFLVKQKEQYQLKFYKMINEGKNDELTQQSTNAIITDSYKYFIESIQNEQKKEILECLEEKRVLFDNIMMYENIDTYYENQVEADVAEYLQYINEPVGIFEKHAIELKKDEIDTFILERSRFTQEIIEENLIALYQVVKQLQDAADQAHIKWDEIQLSDYFKIEHESIELKFQDVYELQDSLSPVINLVFRRILMGIFDMSQFQQQIEGPQKQKLIYLFTPRNLDDNGPLEIFANYYLKNNIQQILENPQHKRLLDTVIIMFQNYQLDENNKVFQINVMIDEIQRKIDEYLSKLKKERDFDENWFDVAGPILNLVNTAVGCKSKCRFCNRKCELGQHTQLEALHSCEKMGHQMRVFAGGNFQNDRGDKFPSLITCDMINPNTIIVLNDQKYTWKEVAETQMQEWEIKFKQQNMGIAKNTQTYRTFWEIAGRQYCQQNNFEYIDYEENQNLITKMFEKTLIIIMIDESGSMSGNRWRNSVNGSQELINFLRQNHSFHRDVHLIIMFYDDSFRIVHNSTLDQPINEDIWLNPNHGGTEFGPMGLQNILKKNQMKSKSRSKIL